MRGGRASSVIDRANAVPVTPALLKRVMQAIDALPAAQRTDFTARGVAMMQVLGDERPDLSAPGEQAALLTALDFHLEALLRLRQSSEYRAWVRDAEPPDRASHLPALLLDTAAIEPLIEHDGHAIFEPTRFFLTALRQCEAEGRA